MVSEKCQARISRIKPISVLILVLVEDGLGDLGGECASPATYMGLNPCFSGGWSRSLILLIQPSYFYSVLILVLVEDGLGAGGLCALFCRPRVLILVLVEDGLGVNQKQPI